VSAGNPENALVLKLVAMMIIHSVEIEERQKNKRSSAAVTTVKSLRHEW